MFSSTTTVNKTERSTHELNTDLTHTPYFQNVILYHSTCTNNSIYTNNKARTSLPQFSRNMNVQTLHAYNASFHPNETHTCEKYTNSCMPARNARLSMCQSHRTHTTNHSIKKHFAPNSFQIRQKCRKYGHNFIHAFSLIDFHENLKLLDGTMWRSTPVSSHNRKYEQ